MRETFFPISFFFFFEQMLFSCGGFHLGQLDFFLSEEKEGKWVREPGPIGDIPPPF